MQNLMHDPRVIRGSTYAAKLESTNNASKGTTTTSTTYYFIYYNYYDYYNLLKVQERRAPIEAKQVKSLLVEEFQHLLQLMDVLIW